MSIIKPINLVFLVVLLYLYPVSIFAQVIINELMPNPEGSDEEGEWVELKNISTEFVTLNGYYLADAQNKILLITSDNTYPQINIDPGGYVVVNNITASSFSLNNSGEEIVHLYKTASPSAQLIDSFSYQGSSQNKTYGRVPDGSSSWQGKLVATKGSTNTIPTPTPEPSIQVTPKITPSATVKPPRATSLLASNIPSVAVAVDTNTPIIAKTQPLVETLSFVSENKPGLTLGIQDPFGIESSGSAVVKSPKFIDANVRNQSYKWYLGASALFLLSGGVLWHKKNN